MRGKQCTYHVQMVRRLVKKKDVGVLARHPAEGDSALLSVAKLTHDLGLGLAGDTEAAELGTVVLNGLAFGVLPAVVLCRGFLVSIKK